MKLIFLLLVTLQVQAQTSYVHPNRVLKAKGYQLGVYADSFTTSKKVDDDGKTESLADGESFNRLQSEISGQYGATDELQLGAGFRFRQNRATYDVSGNEEVASSRGLESTFLTIAYGFKPVDKIQYTLEGAFRYRPFTNNEFDFTKDDPNELILGDDGSEASAGLGMTYLGGNDFFISLRGGYRQPGTDLAHELYWQAEAALAWKYFALIAGVNGITSLGNDPYESNPAERPIMNAQTNLYTSTNREMIAPYAGVNIALGNTWRVELRGSQTISGNSTDLGTTLGINLIRRVEKTNTRVLDTQFKVYDVEATVKKVSPKKEYVEIDKGIADEINKGMRVDFFEFDYVGGNVLIATGIVVKSKADSAIVKITQRFNLKKELKEGVIGRTLLK